MEYDMDKCYLQINSAYVQTVTIVLHEPVTREPLQFIGPVSHGPYH